MKLQVCPTALRIAAVVSFAAMPLAWSSPAHADDAAPPAGTYIWTWKHTKGDIQHFTTVSRMTAHIPGADIKLESVTTETLKETVTDVADNGDVTLEEMNESSQTNVIGVDQPNGAAGAAGTATVNSHGIILKTSSDAAGSDSNMAKAMTMASMTPLPDHPVKPGDSWTTEIDNRLMPGTKVTMTSTLQRIINQNGIDLLKVHTKIAIPKDKDGTEIKAECNYNVDPNKGEVVAANSTFDNLDLPVGKHTLPVHVEMTQTLIPPAVAPQAGPAPQPQPTIEDVTAE